MAEIRAGGGGPAPLPRAHFTTSGDFGSCLEAALAQPDSALGFGPPVPSLNLHPIMCWLAWPDATMMPPRGFLGLPPATPSLLLPGAAVGAVTPWGSWIASAPRPAQWLTFRNDGHLRKARGAVGRGGHGCRGAHISSAAAAASSPAARQSLRPPAPCAVSPRVGRGAGLSHNASLVSPGGRKGCHRGSVWHLRLFRCR